MYDIIADMNSDTPKNVILDTDTYNEVDDQFALAYALLSGKIELLSVNTAPFLNDRSTSPEDGMEKSYTEILNIMKLVGKSAPVYKGSRRFLTAADIPEDTPAAHNIIDTARSTSGRLYVCAIGAITNVASAILMAPDIKDKIVVIWLGGNAHHWQSAREFNLYQDIYASKIIFDSGAPFMQLPCMGVVSELHTCVAELDHYLAGKNALCDYLCDIVRSYTSNPYGWSKVIWDVSAIAALTVPHALDRVVKPTPYLSSDCVYSIDEARHPMIYVRWLSRDAVFADLFKTISSPVIGK
ncbi:MAG: nucleoside hydrolase [Eubacteriales bacterium]